MISNICLYFSSLPRKLFTIVSLSLVMTSYMYPIGAFFSPSTKRSKRTRGIEICNQNMIVFQKQGIMIVLATFFPFCSFSRLLYDQSALVNIFLKLFFCSCKRDNVMKAVGNRVLAGLSSFLCPIKCLIMLSNPE